MSWFERHPRVTLATAVVVLLAVADLLAGLLTRPDPSRTGPRTPFERFVAEIEVHEHRVQSDFYHHGFRPLDRFEDRWGEARVPVVTNSLGLRDAAQRTIDPQRLPRLVLLGDSFVEGVGVPYERTFAGLVAARLEPRGVDVLDAGVAGYSPKLYYWRLRWLLDVARVRVSELVVFVDTSDPHNEIEYETWEPRGEIVQSAWSAAELSTRWSFTARVLRAAYGRAVAQPDEARIALLQKIDEELYQFDEPPVAARWGRRGLELCEEYMQRLAALCRERGIRLTVAVYPSAAQIWEGRARPPWVERWERFAARNQVGFLDLYATFFDPALLSGLPPPPRGITPWVAVAERYYLSGDVHWNEAGHALVAERLSAILGAP